MPCPTLPPILPSYPGPTPRYPADPMLRLSPQLRRLVGILRQRRRLGATTTAAAERVRSPVLPLPPLAPRCACAGFSGSGIAGRARGSLAMMMLAPFLHIPEREMKTHTVTCVGMQSPACCVSAMRRSTLVATCQLLQD